MDALILILRLKTHTLRHTRYIFVFFVLFLTNEGFGQFNSTKKVYLSAGPSFFGSGDLIGMTAGSGFNTELNNILSFDLYLHASFASRLEEFGRLNQLSALGIDFQVFLLPFRKEDGWFSIGLGPSFRRINQISGSGYILQRNSNTPIRKGNFGTDVTVLKQNTLGLAGSLNFRLFQTNRVSLNLRQTMQALYTNGDINHHLLLLLNVKI